jgi:hypothetical protein
VRAGPAVTTARAKFAATGRPCKSHFALLARYAKTAWGLRPLNLEQVSSAYFDDPGQFPPGPNPSARP